MASVNATIRIRAIEAAELWEFVDLLGEMGKRVLVVECFDTPEESKAVSR